jgi:uncharacterized protein (TIGR02145 family)
MKILNLFICTIILALMISCGNDSGTNPNNTTAPVLTTSTVSVITQTTAQCGGTITSDGGATVTARGVCWSINQTPTLADSKTTDGLGTGIFTSSITNLSANTTYFVRAYATNSAGTAYGSPKSFTTISSASTVVDIDGNEYQTISIGNQVWMAENLKVTHYRNGDAIPNVTDGDSWTFQRNGAYCEYNNDVNSVAIYGRLYNWHVVADSRHIAPVGWHVPTDEEWKQLEMFLGMSRSEADTTGWRGAKIFNVGGKLKETGTAHWISPNEGATNESGFTALAGGLRNSIGHFNSVGTYAYFWSATESYSHSAWSRILNYNYSEVNRYSSDKESGLSLRCVKD